MIVRHKNLSRLWAAAATLVVAAALLPAASAAGAPLVAAAPTTVASDTFSRTGTGAWGSADTGGPYTLDGGAGAFSVNGTTGAIALAKAGANRAAYLNGVSVRDVNITVRVALDRLPTGAGAWAYAIVRHNGTSEYRPKIVINANGTLSVHAGVVVNGVESAVAPAVPVPSVVPAAGSYIWLRTAVTGSSPTTINVKAWADGSTEPSGWQFSATNAQPALQGPGSVGLRAYVSSITNAPINVSFDDLSVASLDAPPAPVAAFTSAQQTGTFTVDFNDASTGAIDQWAWDFGDGASDTVQNPSHDYATDGAYAVSLTVSGPGGSDTTTTEIQVEPAGPAVVTLLSDDFNRAPASSWGAAPVGGVYSYQGRLADFTTDGQAGLLTLPSANTTRSVFALSTLAGDVDVSFAVSLDKPASGAATWIYATVRRTADGYAYRPKIRLAPNGAVYAQASKLTASGEKSLGTEVLIAGLTQAPNAVIRVHVQAIGANPTTIRVRAWPDGSPEPDVWQFSATDTTAALQDPGALGLLAYVSSGGTNVPLTVRFDDLLATTTNPVHRVSGAKFVGAGDISSCTTSDDEATARLLDMLPGDVFTLGDNAYPNGSSADFANCYAPTWGRDLSRTHPAPGNHEYQTPGAAPYFAYFGSAAGDPSKGYYAFDEGSWRIYVLNSNCGFVACSAGSAQEQWLRADLTTNVHQCALAITHAPRFSSGSEHGSSPNLQALWQALYDNGADLVLSGHDHDYERFAPMNSAGALDPTLGMRQFVVGTGGVGLRPTQSTPVANSEVRQASSFGVLNLVLGAGEYEWDFIPVAGQLFSDRGSGTCH